MENSSWVYIVFKDQKITAAPNKIDAKLPAPLQEARKLQKKRKATSESEAALFLSQARLLVDYEDDFKYNGTAAYFYPSYRNFTNAELRGYFSWRTKIRKGEFPDTSHSFIRVYLYELLNNVGVASPEEGFEKIRLIQEHYKSRDYDLQYYLERWLPDYVGYYGLNPDLLDYDARSTDEALEILANMSTESQERIINAVKEISPNWLSRSRYYAAHSQEMDSVIANILRQMSAHYAKKCKKTFIDQYFGPIFSEYYLMFSGAIFGNPLERTDYLYALNSQWVYRCEKGTWTLSGRERSYKCTRKLDKLLKTIDAQMRDIYHYGHAIKSEAQPKWIMNLIREKAQNSYAALHPAPSPVPIDFSSLSRIREDAAHVQERLIVDEELDEPPVASIPEPVQESLLNESETRFLQDLLYEREYGWIKEKGLMLSVLVDSINEKLYEEFEDSVLDESPQVIADYLDKLKEMFPV